MNLASVTQYGTGSVFVSGLYILLRALESSGVGSNNLRAAGVLPLFSRLLAGSGSEESLAYQELGNPGLVSSFPQRFRPWSAGRSLFQRMYSDSGIV